MAVRANQASVHGEPLEPPLPRKKLRRAVGQSAKDGGNVTHIGDPLLPAGKVKDPVEEEIAYYIKAMGDNLQKQVMEEPAEVLAAISGSAAGEYDLLQNCLGNIQPWGYTKLVETEGLLPGPNELKVERRIDHTEWGHGIFSQYRRGGLEADASRGMTWVGHTHTEDPEAWEKAKNRAKKLTARSRRTRRRLGQPKYTHHHFMQIGDYYRPPDVMWLLNNPDGNGMCFAQPYPSGVVDESDEAALRKAAYAHKELKYRKFSEAMVSLSRSHGKNSKKKRVTRHQEMLKSTLKADLLEIDAKLGEELVSLLPWSYEEDLIEPSDFRTYLGSENGTSVSPARAEVSSTMVVSPSGVAGMDTIEGWGLIKAGPSDKAHSASVLRAEVTVKPNAVAYTDLSSGYQQGATLTGEQLSRLQRTLNLATANAISKHKGYGVDATRLGGAGKHGEAANDEEVPVTDVEVLEGELLEAQAKVNGDAEIPKITIDMTDPSCVQTLEGILVHAREFEDHISWMLLMAKAKHGVVDKPTIDDLLGDEDTDPERVMEAELIMRFPFYDTALDTYLRASEEDMLAMSILTDMSEHGLCRGYTSACHYLLTYKHEWLDETPPANADASYWDMRLEGRGMSKAHVKEYTREMMMCGDERDARHMYHLSTTERKFARANRRNKLAEWNTSAKQPAHGVMHLRLAEERITMSNNISSSLDRIDGTLKRLGKYLPRKAVEGSVLPARKKRKAKKARGFGFFSRMKVNLRRAYDTVIGSDDGKQHVPTGSFKEFTLRAAEIEAYAMAEEKARWRAAIETGRAEKEFPESFEKRGAVGPKPAPTSADIERVTEEVEKARQEEQTGNVIVVPGEEFIAVGKARSLIDEMTGQLLIGIKADELERARRQLAPHLDRTVDLTQRHARSA